MDCESFGKYLDNYENLTEQEKNGMDEHAAKCEECRAELDFFLSMISTAKSLPKIEPSADFMDKLNARLDAEDKRVVSASGIIGHFRRYGTRYAAAAACLALVGVITANRSLLTGKMDTVPDGIIREETTVSDGSANDSGNAAVDNPTADAAEEAHGALPEAAPAPNADNTAPVRNTVDAPAVTRQSGNAPSGGTVRASVPSAVRETPSRPSAADTTSIPAVEAPQENAAASEPISDAEGAEIAPVNTSPDENVPVMTRSVPENSAEAYQKTDNDGYSIALASIVNGDDAPETYDLRAEDVPESLKAAEIQANYSLAGTDDNDIARGRYSKLNKDGIPIADAPAIGSIQFSSDDEERAMEVINRYTVDEEDNIYTTDTVNLRLILSRLNREGIEYSDYTVSGSGEVKFRIEFN